MGNTNIKFYLQRRMAHCKKEMGISNVVIQCGSLASILEGCLGPYGKAVLMERAGCVIITQDGMELLSTLDVCDPVLNMVVRGVVDQTKFLGDGCKISFLLLRRLLSSLDNYVSTSSCISQALRRKKMVQITQKLRKYVLGSIQKDVIKYGTQVYPLHSYEALGHILQSASEYFFQTKFSKLIARNLAQLLSTYLFYQCSSSEELLRLLNELTTNVHLAVVEIYSMPLLKSHVISGFVVTRTFKYLHQCMKFENVSLVLWSMDIEEEKEDGIPSPIIETSSDQVLLEGIFLKQKLLSLCFASLKSLGVQIIFSSIYFPDWAVLQCRRYGFSLVDMIDSEEWSFLIRKLKLAPVMNRCDIHAGSVRLLERIEPIVIGTSRFIRLQGFNVHQIMLCGPTSTQCKQFSTAFHKLFRYLNSWLVESVNFCQASERTRCEDIENMNAIDCDYRSPLWTSPMTHDHVLAHQHFRDTIEENFCTNVDLAFRPQSPALVLYSVPHGGYVELLAKFLVMENVSGSIDNNINRLIITEVFDEIPWLLHKKRRSKKRYLELQTTLFSHFRKLRTDNQKFALPHVMEEHKFLGYQNPFILFKILDSVFLFAEFILRIECIVPAKSRISEFVRRCDREDSDDD